MGIVIDTNVLEHADNPTEKRQSHCKALLDYISGATGMILYIDDGFDINEARNSSKIWSEYIERLPPGSAGHSFLLLLSGLQQIDTLSKVVSSSISKKIRQKVHDSSDIVFAKVTHNSPGKILVSHDFTHFSNASRKFLEDAIGIQIIDAKEYME